MWEILLPGQMSSRPMGGAANYMRSTIARPNVEYGWSCCSLWKPRFCYSTKFIKLHWTVTPSHLLFCLVLKVEMLRTGWTHKGPFAARFLLIVYNSQQVFIQINNIPHVPRPKGPGWTTTHTPNFGFLSEEPSWPN
jgi:hypothetical protein